MNASTRNEQENEQAAPVARPWLARNRTAAKMTAVAVIILLLQIPLALVKGVLDERTGRRTEAVRELSATWGARQELIGPILVVPYRQKHTARREILVNGDTSFTDETHYSTAHAFFLPSSCRVIGTLDPRSLRRGIYDAVVYRGDLEISGEFAPPSFEEWSVAPEDILWNEAFITIGLTDLRGVEDALTLTWSDQSLDLSPVTGWMDLPAGVRTHHKGILTPGRSASFHLNLSLNGSAGIRIAPVGERNEVTLHSSWPDPSFQGSLLPVERTVTADGFDVTWKSSYYGRAYPQQWSTAGNVRPTRNDLSASTFGVDLITPVDHYRLVERSIKYGILFVTLVFTAFFLFELIGRVRIHPFQYTMAGFALCMFYLVLLSLSEFTSFGVAYAAGAASCTLMITCYSAKALRSGYRALTMAGELSAIYGILYVTLRLQDYSLLLGTAGLFTALAVVMFATRNIDWYARDAEQDRAPKAVRP